MKLTFVLFGVFLIVAICAASKSGSKQKKSKYRSRSIPAQQVQDEETEVNVVVQQAPRVVQQRKVIRQVVEEPEVVFVPSDPPCNMVDDDEPVVVRRVQPRPRVVEVVEDDVVRPLPNDQVVVKVVNKKTNKPVQVQDNGFRRRGSGSGSRGKKGKKGRKYNCS